MTQIPGSVYQPTIAILTALPKEHAAVHALLDHSQAHSETDQQGTRLYRLGTMPSRQGGRHALVLAMVGVGNGISAVATTQLLNDFPSVRTLILTGIAGGVPHPVKPDDHVRLGDIVASNEYGVIQYDFVKEEADDIIPRHPPRPASANLVRAARLLESENLSGARPWDEHVDLVLASLRWRRPAERSDRLASSSDPSATVAHPRDPRRTRRRPRVFLGPIASSNTLLKNPIRRDHLRDRHGVKAVEMEGSGTADSAWMAQAHHFVIRGICDYCDANKGDGWQNYAAAVAAGYLKAVLRKIDTAEQTSGPATRGGSGRVETARARIRRGEPLPGGQDTLELIDETQTRLQSMLAENGRDAAPLIPTLSWLTSIDRKLHEDRLLAREGQALEAVHAEVRRAGHHVTATNVSPVERLSLNLLERYRDSSVLRTNWEVRCAIGNLLTPAVSARSKNCTSTLIATAMQESDSTENWDLAQMLFDALHHADGLSRSGREFLLSTAVEHEHRQVRWNVAAALKSVRLSDRDLGRLITRLLQDRSSWVVKELIDVGLKNERVTAELSRPRNAARILDLLESDSQLRAHTVLSLSAGSGRTFIPQLPSIRPGSGGIPEQPAAGQRLLVDDFRRVEVLKSALKGQPGKLYRAADRVVSHRIGTGGPEAQQRAITAYLHSTHEALAWASVRAFFSGKLDGCPDDFLGLAVADMLTHSSDWIRRECVEETLRLRDGRRKYLALRQIERHRTDLADVDEIRPYLTEIGMRVGVSS
jgi:nucleoside phosphorylase